MSVSELKPAIIYEDDDTLVINKPAGLNVHIGHGHELETTVTNLFKAKIQDSDKLRPGIVHRLDRNTSGIMILAKNKKAKQFLQNQFKKRLVSKKYIALVHGQPIHPEAILDWPVGRSPRNPFKQAVTPRGKPAVTQYRVIKSVRGYSLLEANPKTGRMHQIRVHLSHLGHPIVGDSVYGKPDPVLKRQFLHSQALKISLPSGTTRTFKAELPVELRQFLDQNS